MRSIPVLETPFPVTPIVRLGGAYSDNEIYMKRDDLLPFSFGGNKARKAWFFYHDIQREQPDVIMTYGSNASNHCRIIANMARSMGLPCHTIANDHEVQGKDGRQLFNRILVEDFGASVETVPVEMVHDTIEKRMKEFRENGKKPYFIQGGGHGNVGTAGYYHAFFEILEQGGGFSHIFCASGTGATQGGLVAGRVVARAQGRQHLPEIVGISIARRNPRGGDVVRESALSYLEELTKREEARGQDCGAAKLNPTEHGSGEAKRDIEAYGPAAVGAEEKSGHADYRAWYKEQDLHFEDRYILGGYGAYNVEVTRTIAEVMAREGIPMDTTYVGKAFTGMLHYLRDQGIHGQKVLFVHTGGTPLFFDAL